MLAADRDDAELPEILVEDDHLRRRLYELHREEPDVGDARRRHEDAVRGRVVDAAAVEDLLGAGARLGSEWNRLLWSGAHDDRTALRGHAWLVAGRFGIPSAASRARLIHAGEVGFAVSSARRRCNLPRGRRCRLG